MVHQHPDGFVYVRESRVAGLDPFTHYGDTDENFLDDFKLTFPPLPDGADERIYEPGKRHAIQNRERIVEGGPMPWEFGETVLRTLSKGLKAWQDRQPPVTPIPIDEMLKLPEDQRINMQNEFAAELDRWQEKENARLARIRG
jgi:hypothetical protein